MGLSLYVLGFIRLLIKFPKVFYFFLCSFSLRSVGAFPWFVLRSFDVRGIPRVLKPVREKKPEILETKKKWGIKIALLSVLFFFRE